MKRPRSQRHSVIVVGAGMSGLACARELLHRGYWVIVVEARHRVGGRLKGQDLVVAPSSNTHSPDSRHDDTRHDVDLGGALIHGTQDNPIAQLTSDLGVSTHPVSDTLLLDKEGWPVDLKEDDRLSTMFNACLEEAFSRAEGKQSNTSFGSLFEAICVEKGVNSTALLRWHKANLEVSCGASFERLGWQWNEDEPYGFDGDHSAIEPSWKAVVESLAEPLDILYDSPIEHIHVVHPTDPSNGVGAPATAADRGQPLVKTKTVFIPSKRPSRKKNDTQLDGPTTQPRHSRRLMGVEANNRRSSRKPQAVDRYSDHHAKKKTAPVASSPIPPEASDKAARNDPVDSRPKRSLVQVTLQNGTVLEADSLVCTVPLGVLKSDAIQFEPPLPTPKIQAIRRLGTGLLNKCALSFPYVFWQDSDFLGLAGEKHSYLVLNGATYTGKPILVFMYGGDFAAEIEGWTDTEVVEDCFKVLKSICGCGIPTLLDYSVTRWGHEEYSQMSFSYVPPGVDGIAELQAISEPILDSTGATPTLLFAGEHTTPYHPSTIHGAFMSGIREAYRLDFALDPEGNNNTSFRENEVYLRTFPVERKYGGSATEYKQHAFTLPDIARRSEPIQRSSSGGHHRHRGASSVMKLRRTNEAATGEMTHTASTPSRRSQRSTVARSPHESSNDDSDKADMKLEDLLDRCLLRGVESYGRDYQFLCDNVLPVYGSCTDTTKGQVRERCRSLVSAKKINKEYPSSASSWRSWGARVVFPSKYDQERDRRSAKAKHSPKRRKVALEVVVPTPAKKIAINKTKSGRKVVPVAATGLGYRKPRSNSRAPVRKTKFGRKVVPTAFLAMD